MLTIYTPSGELELKRDELFWTPRRGSVRKIGFGENIINSCICPGPQKTVTGILLFGSEGLVIHLRLPSLAPIQTLRLEQPPDAVQIVYDEGCGYLVIAEEKTLKFRLLNSLERIVSVIGCQQKIDLLHLDGQRLIIVHGFETTALDLTDIIPLRQQYLAMESLESDR